MIIADSPAWTNPFDLAADSMRKGKKCQPLLFQLRALPGNVDCDTDSCLHAQIMSLISRLSKRVYLSPLVPLQ